MLYKVSERLEANLCIVDKVGDDISAEPAAIAIVKALREIPVV